MVCRFDPKIEKRCDYITKEIYKKHTDFLIDKICNEINSDIQYEKKQESSQINVRKGIRVVFMKYIEKYFITLLSYYCLSKKYYDIYGETKEFIKLMEYLQYKVGEIYKEKGYKVKYYTDVSEGGKVIIIYSTNDLTESSMLKKLNILSPNDFY